MKRLVMVGCLVDAFSPIARFRVRWGVPHLSATLLVAAILWPLCFASPVAAADGRTDTAVTTYTLNPAAGGIDVVIDFVVKNTTSNTTAYVSCTQWAYDPWLGYYPIATTCPQTTRYYFDTTAVWLEQGLTALKATANGGAASLTIDKRAVGFNLYTVKFPKIFNGQTRRIHITYRIPGGAPRSASTTRVGKAFASFCAIANGLDGGSTRVVVQSSFAMELTTNGGTLKNTTAKGLTTYDTGTVSDTGAFFACFSGDNPAGYLTSSAVSPGGRQVTVQAWPEDPTWNDQVKGQITAALGQLERLVGRPLPGAGPITVREVTSATLGAAYSGAFDPFKGIARVGEDLTQSGVVAHELSHAWFNDSMFDVRWLSEGSASWAESAITGTPCIDPGTFPATGSPSLTDWKFAGPKATDAELKVIAWEYDASCYLASNLAGRVGDDHMKTVLAALLDHHLAYQSPGIVLQGHSGPSSWRDWLDAIDELGFVPAGSTDLDYAQNLILKFGGTGDTASLPARSKARAAYHELIGAVAPWTIPEAILKPMGEWNFTDATTAIQSASSAFASATDVAKVLPEVGALNGPVKPLFEEAKTLADMHQAELRAGDQKAAADAVAAAKARVEAPRDFLTQVGLIGTDLQPTLMAAIAAVAAIDLKAAQSDAATLTSSLTDAAQQGTVRVGLTFAVLLVLLVLAVFLVRRRRVRTRRSLIVAVPQVGELAMNRPDRDLSAREVSEDVGIDGLEGGARASDSPLVSATPDNWPPSPPPPSAPVMTAAGEHGAGQAVQRAPNRGHLAPPQQDMLPGAPGQDGAPGRQEP